jgi:hypothetical protein
MHANAHLGCQCDDLHAGLILAFLFIYYHSSGENKKQKKTQHLFFSDYTFTFIPVECASVLDY